MFVCLSVTVMGLREVATASAVGRNINAVTYCPAHGTELRSHRTKGHKAQLKISAEEREPAPWRHRDRSVAC